MFISKLGTTFSMKSCISTNIVPGVGWYVDDGDSRHMKTNTSTLLRLEEQVIDMHVNLGDDGKYPVIGLGSIPFCMLEG
jgi:hypothetical protein